MWGVFRVGARPSFFVDLGEFGWAKRAFLGVCPDRKHKLDDVTIDMTSFYQLCFLKLPKARCLEKRRQTRDNEIDYANAAKTHERHDCP